MGHTIIQAIDGCLNSSLEIQLNLKLDIDYLSLKGESDRMMFGGKTEPFCVTNVTFPKSPINKFYSTWKIIESKSFTMNPKNLTIFIVNDSLVCNSI